MKLIFNHVRGAAAIAQYLRGEWDGFNAVLFDSPIDFTALRQAIALVKLELDLELIEYCRVEQDCSLFQPIASYAIPVEDPQASLALDGLTTMGCLSRKLGSQYIISAQDPTALFVENYSDRV